MSLFAVLFLIGFSLAQVGWACFRSPDVGCFRFVPMWKARDYFHPPGVALWAEGLIVCGGFRLGYGES